MGSMHDYIYEGYDDKREGCLPGIVGSTTTLVVLSGEALFVIKSGIAGSRYGIIFLPIIIIIAIAGGLVIKEILVKIKEKKEEKGRYQKK